MNKKLIVSLGTLAVLSSVFFGAVVSQAQDDGFPDVPGSHVNAQAINYLKLKSVLQGDDEAGTFRPAANLNRAEFAAIIARLAAVSPDKNKYRNCFPDVKEEWFAPYVCWAKEQGYVKGFEAGNLKGMYGPDQTLINAETIVILSRMAGWDVKEADVWYEGAMAYAKDKGILDAGFDKKISRAVMAETVFRAAVSSSNENNEYSKETGDSFIENKNEVTLGVATADEKVEEPTAENTEEKAEENNAENNEETKSEAMKVMVKPVEYKPAEAKEDATDLTVLKFMIENPSTTDDLVMTGVKVVKGEKTNMDYVAALSLKDKDGKVVAGPLMKRKDPKWMEGMINFGDFEVTIGPESKTEYMVTADLDMEMDGVVQFKLAANGDVMFKGEVEDGSEYPIMGPVYEVGVEVSKNAEQFPVCANFDPESNLPYASNTQLKDKKPVEAGKTVAAPEGGHNIDPIDQGNEGICMAAATYSSLRWFENNLEIDEDLVENGENGLQDLVDDLYSEKIDTPDKQLAELERKLEAEHPGCVEVEYDTQAGLNVACTELKEYKDKGCDIPLVFYCTKVDENGDPIEGEEAENWGHAVDLVDVQVDGNDDDKCSITYANSWNDAQNPRPDVDGLGSGRYEKADYDDDSEDFDIKAPWGAQYKCELYAAAYICLNEDQCKKEK